MTQEQSILSKIKTMFPAETILLQNRIDTYFPKHKLAIEIDELPPGDRNIDKEVSRRKAIKKELDCEFNRINPAKVYFDVLDDIVDEYNNTYHRTIKMKLIGVGDDSFGEYNEESNEKDSKFKVGDHVRISKYKNILLKDILLTRVKKFLL